MTPSRPYLLRAFYDWIVDNDWTPYVVLNAYHSNVVVPEEYVENGRIILDVSPNAVRDLALLNSHIEFDARFKGIPFQVFAPIRGVLAIYAKENGQGMAFKEDEEGEEEPPPSFRKREKARKQEKKKGAKPHLVLIKGDIK